MTTDLSPKAAEIVACAQSLLAAGGYNAFSYADISAKVQISKPSIHHHFASKEELVRTVLALYRERAREGLAALSLHTPDPAAQLQAYAAYWAACIRDGSSMFCICAMLAAELPCIPSSVADEVRGHFLDLGRWLTSVMAEGVSRKVFALNNTPEAEAMAFMATVHGAMLSARAYGDPEVFSNVVDPLVRRLQTR